MRSKTTTCPENVFRVVCGGYFPNQENLFLFMPILAQTFFPFVRGHFMPFSFFSAGHGIVF
jgi:hypothetical protein